MVGGFVEVPLALEQVCQMIVSGREIWIRCQRALEPFNWFVPLALPRQHERKPVVGFLIIRGGANSGFVLGAGGIQLPLVFENSAEMVMRDRKVRIDRKSRIKLADG